MTSKQRAYLKSIAMTSRAYSSGLENPVSAPEFTPVGEGSSGCEEN